MQDTTSGWVMFVGIRMALVMLTIRCILMNSGSSGKFDIVQTGGCGGASVCWVFLMGSSLLWLQVTLR